MTTRKLKEEIKKDLINHIRKEFKSKHNKETDGMVLAYYVISLVENCHLYDNWFE